MTTIQTDASPEEVLKLLHALPRILSGQQSDPAGIARAVALRMGVALLSKVQQAFLVKARGGTDEAGIKWQPLAPATVERRGLGRQDRKALNVKQRTKDLTPAQQKTYRREYNRRLASLVLRGLDPARASGLARAQTLNVIRAQGGKVPTRRQILGGRSVEILKDTGELFRSFSPGIEDRPSGASGQVFQAFPGRVMVGTNKKPWHHTGNRNLPARPYWPPNGNLPESWWSAVLEAGQRGLLLALAPLLTRSR